MHMTSGWNMFVAQEMAHSPIPNKDRLKIIATQWHDLTQREQQVWNSLAHDASLSLEKKPVKKTKLSGYNYYMKTQSVVLHEQVKDGKQRVAQIVGSWKALSLEEKKIWNESAERL